MGQIIKLIKKEAIGQMLLWQYIKGSGHFWRSFFNNRCGFFGSSHRRNWSNLCNFASQNVLRSTYYSSQKKIVLVRSFDRTAHLFFSVFNLKAISGGLKMLKLGQRQYANKNFPYHIFSFQDSPITRIGRSQAVVSQNQIFIRAQRQAFFPAHQ